MNISIYFSDINGELATNKFMHINDLPKFEDCFFICHNEMKNSRYVNENLEIGDILYASNWIVIVSYYNVRLSNMSNYNWSLFISNILKIMNIENTCIINLYLTNVRNILKDTQSYNTHINIVNSLLMSLTDYNIQIL